MRRIVYTQHGGPEVLSLVEEPTPKPGPGQVRVQIHRSGVNPTDWKSRSGATAGTSDGAAQTPNQDGSGVVDAVGEGVDAGLVGQRVWVWEAAFQRPYGTAADCSIVPVGRVAPLPDAASFDLGASLGVPFITAHRCLTVREEGPMALHPGALAGQTVLVAGGAGAVGNAAIQLARWADATVITTVSSPAKALLAAAAGADHVLDYTTQDVAAEVRRIVPGGVDTIVEVSIAGNAGLDAKVLAANGVIASYANNGGDEFTFPVRPLMSINARLQFVLLYTVPEQAKRRAVAEIVTALEAGVLRTGDEAGLPLHHFPLEDTAGAHLAVEGGAVGKVLIDVVP